MVENDGSALQKLLLLTDCCSLFSITIRMQPVANERCARISIAHLRDLQALLAIGFADSAPKLGDVGAQHDGRLRY